MSLFKHLMTKSEIAEYGKSPHVCFVIDLGSGANAKTEFSRVFRQFLRDRFRQVWFLFFVTGAASAKREERFYFNFWASARAARCLILMIHPADREERLMAVCRELHLFLTNTPGITRVWWYFRAPEGLREEPETQAVGVLTPDELPWNSPPSRVTGAPEPADPAA